MQWYKSVEKSSVWGRSEVTLPPHYAAFVNGVAVRLANKLLLTLILCILSTYVNVFS